MSSLLFSRTTEYDYSFRFGEGGYTVGYRNAEVLEGRLCSAGDNTLALELYPSGTLDEAALYAAYIARGTKRTVVIAMGGGYQALISPEDVDNAEPLDGELALRVLNQFAHTEGHRLSIPTQLALGSVAINVAMDYEARRC